MRGTKIGFTAFLLSCFSGGAARVVRLAINGARQVKSQSSESDISVFDVPSIRESSEMGKHIDDAYSMLHPVWP